MGDHYMHQENSAAWTRVLETEKNLETAIQRAKDSPTTLHETLATMSQNRHDRAITAYLKSLKLPA